MDLLQKTGLARAAGKTDSSDNDEQPSLPVDRCLTTLIDGAALCMPEVDPTYYPKFRADVNTLSVRIADQYSPEEKLHRVRAVLLEFEAYHQRAEQNLRDRQTGWRAIAALLLRELLAQLGVNNDDESSAALRERLNTIVTGEEVQAFYKTLTNYLHPTGSENGPDDVSPLRVADRSMANHNAAGLRGGGVAVEHLRSILDRGHRGFVVLFQLSCMDVISERFGLEAVEDCLMAVSAFLTSHLHREDIIYHWSDSSLMAIMEGRANEQILNSELQRIASRNREITIQVGGRAVMLRVPLDFEIIPTTRFRAPEDLYKLAGEESAWVRP